MRQADEFENPKAELAKADRLVSIKSPDVAFQESVPKPLADPSMADSKRGRPLAESEATPIIDVTEVLGAGADPERAIRWRIAPFRAASIRWLSRLRLSVRAAPDNSSLAMT